MTRLLLALIFLVPASSAQLPVLGPEFGAAGDLVPTEGGGEQSAPWVASGDGTALAVWVDHRAEFNSPLANQGSPDIFAIRVDSNGSPLDAVALRLPDAVGDAQRPRAAWNGSAWLVVWENQKPDGTSSSQRVFLGARVSGGGVLLDTEPIEIVTHGEAIGSSLGLGSDGDDWIVTFQGSPVSSTGLFAVRVLSDGSIPSPAGVQIASASTAIFDTSISFASGRYLFLYSNGTVRGRLLNQDLTPSGASFVIASGSNYHPRLATDGVDFLATWATQGTPDRVSVRRVSGTTGSQSGPILVSSPSDYARDPSVAWSGQSWHVVFRFGLFDQHYRAARFDADLTFLNPGGDPLQVSGVFGESRMVVGGTGQSAVIAYEEVILSELWPGAIGSSRIDEQGFIGETFQISRSAPRQGFSDMASAPGQFAVAYYAEDERQTRIRLARFDLSGQALSTEPVELAVGTRLRQPAVAFDGEHYIVVWQNDNVAGFETDDEIYGRRVTPGGVLVDPAPFFVMEGRNPDIAANGGVSLVVASESLGDPDFRFVFAQRVERGSPQGSAELIGANFARFPQVAPMGAGWVATWQRNPSHDNPNGSARAAIIGPDGTAGAELSVSAGSGVSGGGYGPRIASSGDGALVIWQTFGGQLGGRRILSNETLGSGFAVTDAPAVASSPALDFDGEDFFIVWEDYRDQVGLFDNRAHVFGARVSQTGSLLDGPVGFPIATGVETEFQPSVASSLGASLITWTEFVPSAPEATLRLRRRRESPWTYASGGFGEGTTPTLEIEGDLVGGDTLRLRVGQAPSTEIGWLVFGFNTLALPLGGGVLVPNPDVVLAIATGVDGVAETLVSVPGSILPGTAIGVQAWLLDPDSASGLTATHALVSTAP